MESDKDPLLVPIQLQAFVLNPAVCNTDDIDDHGARIMPITQPNYTFLRLDNFLIQSDVLNHADLHCSAPADANPRMTDLGARPATERRDRQGVYLHWILPQTYRSGVASADSVSKERREDERLKHGLAPTPSESSSDPKEQPSRSPEFLEPPTRWIVIRKLDMDSISPVGAKPFFKEYEAWVIESDYRWSLHCIPQDYDLQVDVSPFVLGVKSGDDTNIEQQAEVFIGRKTPLETWTDNPDACRADITLLRSSNQLFADFQLHNTNVFSMLDNFEYFDRRSSKEPMFLKEAKASYYLFGWHRDEQKDPLWATGRSHAERIQGIFMSLKQSGIDETTNSWLKAEDPTHLCLHGALYDVQWDHKNKPTTVPADKYAEALRNKELPAISVGTSPIDALITYCSSRSDKESDELIKRLEEDILLIDSLLHARDDGVEGQREAKDIAYNWSFNRSQGGIHYFIAGEESEGDPIKPDPKSSAALRTLNEHQSLLDACRKGAQQYRWDIFSLWWKYVTDVANKTDRDVNSEFEGKVKIISDKLGRLNSRIDDLDGLVKKLIKDGKAEGGFLQGVKTGTDPFYYRPRDPTVLVGAIDHGWPSDFNDDIEVRIPAQTVKAEGAVPKGLSDLVGLIGTKFAGTGALKDAEKLCQEFWALVPNKKKDSDASLGKGQAYPQFHDKRSLIKDNKLWRDRWEDRQPWFPLYAEWEVEYTHVPFKEWQLDQQASRLSDSKKARYGIPTDDGIPLWQKMQEGKPQPVDDIRTLSGRVLILPQPSFSLKAKVKQLFADTPPSILKPIIDCEKQEELSQNIDRLSFLSAPLAGLSEGLLTLSQGTHIKPENKYIENGIQRTSAVGAAVFENAGLSKKIIEMIQNNSALTPYSSMSDFMDSDFCPFKPVTHGQFRFTKFNIIDKFGQTLLAIDPIPRVGGPEPLYPCISDYYEPQVVDLKDKDRTKAANTVMKNDGSKCEFIQLPPQINQSSRLNAHFVVYSGDDEITKEHRPYWRPATEWENPIWGWVVLNYADQGIQLFLPNGMFYREVRFGGPGGTITEPKWLPFAPDPHVPPVANTAQLDALITRLGNDKYARGFWDMLSLAVDNMAPAPSAYAEFVSSIVGKPLALANMGWSLELEGAPLENESTRSGHQKPPLHLTPESKQDKNSYEFQVKLGDFFREYDGLVGYFDANPEPKFEEKRSNELKLDEIKTYFIGGSKAENLKPISKDNYPKFKPFWTGQFDDKTAVEPADYTDRQVRQLHIFGAILDPFTPIHGYSSLLPTRILQLPSWTWQAPMENMTAFFHAGPLTLTEDPGEYDPKNPLTTETVKKRPVRNAALPALPEGDWSWLQPFVDETPGSNLPIYNAYGIEEKGNPLKPGFQKGPYTAIEGFLQLRQPMNKDKDKKPKQP